MKVKKVNKRKRADTPFGNNLIKILKERGVSIRAAAEIAGVSPSMLSSWTAGVVPHDLIAVQRLARALNVSFEWLLTGSASEVDPNNVSLTELFEEQGTPFEGLFKISATRLVRRGEKE